MKNKKVIKELEKAIKQKGSLLIKYEKDNKSFYAEMGKEGDIYTASNSLDRLILGLIDLFEYEKSNKD